MSATELTSVTPNTASTPNTLDHNTAKPCAACGHLHTSPFCPQCGQRRSNRLVTSAVLKETFSTLLSLEGPWLRTIKDLLLRPSSLILAYLAGARRRYVNPVLLVIVSYSFFFLLSHWLGIDPFAGGAKPSSIEQSVLNFVTNYSGQLSVLIAYPAAMLMRRVWPGTTTAERYVALLYAQSLSAIVGILLLLEAAVVGHYDFNLNYLVSLLATLYAYFGVHPSRWRSLLIGVLASVIYLLVVMVIAFVVGFIAAVFLGLVK